MEPVLDLAYYVTMSIVLMLRKGNSTAILWDLAVWVE
jgi:hypothetical protein